MNWEQIKTEYITDAKASYRKLAQKYGVTYQAVGSIAKREGWVEKKKEYQKRVFDRTLNLMADEQVERLVTILSVTDKLVKKIEETVDAMKEPIIDTQVFRQFTSALKDIKDIQMLKSELDIREQEARVIALEKQSDEEKQNNTVVVTIQGGEASWQK